MSSPAPSNRHDAEPASSTAYADKVYDVEFAETGERLEAYADFAAIVKHLRRDCPWDREQTHESVKHLLIEEAYEVVEAIETGDPEELKKELGDVFLHVLFHSRIAEEEGRFTIQDVIEAETEKLVRRHPHVFGPAASGDGEEMDPAEVEKTWEQIKQDERDGDDEAPRSALEGVPASLPSLLRAYRVQQKAAGVGFDFPTRDGAWAKVEEEIREFQQTVERGASTEAREDEFGDVLFALVNYARFADVNPENALRGTLGKFTRRFQYIERRLDEQGKTWDDVDLSAADELWDEAKSRE